MRSVLKKLFYGLIYLAPIALLTLAACGGGGGSSAPVFFNLAGNTKNLKYDGLALANSGVTPIEELPVIKVASGVSEFKFSAVPKGGSYGVSVLKQPKTTATSPMNQRCAVTSNNAFSTSMQSDVNNIVVECIDVFTVGGTILNLRGGAFELQNNGAEILAVSAPVAPSVTLAFTFNAPLLDSETYDVTILSQPNGQTCIFNPPQSAVGAISGDNVTNVTIACSP